MQYKISIKYLQLLKKKIIKQTKWFSGKDNKYTNKISIFSDNKSININVEDGALFLIQLCTEPLFELMKWKR